MEFTPIKIIPKGNGKYIMKLNEELCTELLDNHLINTRKELSPKNLKSIGRIPTERETKLFKCIKKYHNNDGVSYDDIRAGLLESWLKHCRDCMDLAIDSIFCENAIDAFRDGLDYGMIDWQLMKEFE